MMSQIKLCLLDCSSIQRYVFGSNKLKTNIGASHVVEKIYQDWIPEVLQQLYPDEKMYRFENWKKKSNTIAILADDNLRMETGYIGGGNALLLFRQDEQNDDAASFIELWTTKLLAQAPGIRPAVATIVVDKANLAVGIKAIFEKLVENKNAYIPITTVARHGITAECRFSGLAAEKKYRLEDEDFWISSVIAAKLDYYPEANAKLKKDYSDYLVDADDNHYEFSHELENLGQSQNVENHVAIVHIDGNAMGEKFKRCENKLERLRALSLKIENQVHLAMATTLSELMQKMPILNQQQILKWKANDSHPKVPIRPIILNGDDITFVCDSRMAFFLAEKFMQAFALDKDNQPSGFSSCAGIAIIKTKYPFYRGYQLAEKLCGTAKKEAKKLKHQGVAESSWLDFHISHRGLSGDLEHIRKQNYYVGLDSLLWRPWRVDPGNDLESFEELKKAITHFRHHPVKTRQWPKSKVQELANTLIQGKAKTEEFIKMMAARGLDLPVIANTQVHKIGWYQADIFKTPYFDIAEVMEFYPQCLL